MDNNLVKNLINVDSKAVAKLVDAVRAGLARVRLVIGAEKGPRIGVQFGPTWLRA